MPNKFKYKDWTFVEYINPRKQGVWDAPRSTTYYDGIYKPNISSAETKAYERIIDWFKHIDSDPTFDSTEIWDSLDSDERLEWFKDSKKIFSRWWNSLPTRLKHYYTDRLMSDKPMLSLGDNAFNKINKSHIPTEAIQVTIIDDKLAITSSRLEVLEDIKIMIEKLHGHVEYEHRTKSLPMDKKSHTFIFDLKK